jgi:hypothetical protein
MLHHYTTYWRSVSASLQQSLSKQMHTQQAQYEAQFNRPSSKGAVQQAQLTCIQEIEPVRPGLNLVKGPWLAIYSVDVAC